MLLKCTGFAKCCDAVAYWLLLRVASDFLEVNSCQGFLEEVSYFKKSYPFPWAWLNQARTVCLLLKSEPASAACAWNSSVGPCPLDPLQVLCLSSLGDRSASLHMAPSMQLPNSHSWGLKRFLSFLPKTLVAVLQSRLQKKKKYLISSDSAIRKALPSGHI